jgi:DNA polymerase elongation subunit (family B)
VKKILEKKPDMPINNLLDKIDEFTEKVFQPIIDAGYEKLAKYVHANENRMFMKRELVISEVFWTAKKKYAMNVWDDEGVRYEKPKMKVKGIEVVRSSTPKIVRDKLKDAIKIILSKDMLDVIEFAKEVQVYFYEQDVEAIAFPRGVSKVSKYRHADYPKELCIKGTPIAVRGALVYNRYIETRSLLKQFQQIRSGDKTKFVDMKKNNPIGENVFGFLKRMPDKERLKKFVDYELQFYKTFMRVLENIYEKIDEPRPFRLDYASEMNSKSFFQKMREKRDSE